MGRVWLIDYMDTSLGACYKRNFMFYFAPSLSHSRNALLFITEFIQQIGGCECNKIIFADKIVVNRDTTVPHAWKPSGAFEVWKIEMTLMERPGVRGLFKK